MTTSGTARTERAGNADTLQSLARVGLVAYGIVHLLVAWLALQLAWGGGRGAADQSGAMATLAREPFGTPLLWVLAVGLVALAVWQLAEVLRYRSQLRSSGEAKKKAVKKIVKAVARRSSTPSSPSPPSASPPATASPAPGSSSRRCPG